MRLGFVGYTSLRSDLLAPRQGPNQYMKLLPDLAERAGDRIHWIPTKHLVPGCESPLPSASHEEVLAHQSVYHYGDSFKPVVQWINKMPAAGRNELSWTSSFDASQLKYDIPFLDACIIEACGQIGGAWSLDIVARLLYAKNPNIGFIVIDQDRTASTTLAKMKKWHPNYKHRVIITSNYLKRLDRFWSQVPTLSPHVPTLRYPTSTEGAEICYIGNDYQRRESMIRFLGHPGFHLWGAMKQQNPTPNQAAAGDWMSITGEDFVRHLESRGCQYHGPFEPSVGVSIETVYRMYGAGICITREDGYAINYYASRPSEIARAGKLAFWDNRLAIGYPLGGAVASVSCAAEAYQRLQWLQGERQYWEDAIHYQWNALNYYTSSERYADAFWFSALHLVNGGVALNFELNLYRDLMEAAGLQPWGRPGYGK